MKTLNLKEFKLFTDISRAGHIVVDARKEFANAICKAVFYDSIMSALKKE